MKKIIFILISVFCIFTTTNSYAASDDDSILKEKLSIVKSRIGSTEQYDYFNSRIFNNGEIICNYTWENTENSDDDDRRAVFDDPGSNGRTKGVGGIVGSE